MDVSIVLAIYPNDSERQSRTRFYLIGKARLYHLVLFLVDLFRWWYFHVIRQQQIIWRATVQDKRSRDNVFGAISTAFEYAALSKFDVEMKYDRFLYSYWWKNDSKQNIKVNSFSSLVVTLNQWLIQSLASIRTNYRRQISQWRSDWNFKVTSIKKWRVRFSFSFSEYSSDMLVISPFSHPLPLSRSPLTVCLTVRLLTTLRTWLSWRSIESFCSTMEEKKEKN